MLGIVSNDAWTWSSAARKAMALSECNPEFWVDVAVDERDVYAVIVGAKEAELVAAGFSRVMTFFGGKRV